MYQYLLCFKIANKFRLDLHHLLDFSLNYSLNFSNIRDGAVVVSLFSLRAKNLLFLTFHFI